MCGRNERRHHLRRRVGQGFPGAYGDLPGAGAAAGGRRCLARAGRGGDRGAGGRVRVGQVDAGTHAAGAAAAHRRAGALSRGRAVGPGGRSVAQIPRRGAGGLPGHQRVAEPAAHHRRQRGRAADLQPRRAPAAGAGRGEPAARPRGARSGHLPRALPAPAQRRAATAGGAGARAGLAATRADRRRAGVGAGRIGTRPGAAAHDRAAGRGTARHPVHYPRPGRGPADRRARPGDVPGERGGGGRDRQMSSHAPATRTRTR